MRKLTAILLAAVLLFVPGCAVPASTAAETASSSAESREEAAAPSALPEESEAQSGASAAGEAQSGALSSAEPGEQPPAGSAAGEEPGAPQSGGEEPQAEDEPVRVTIPEGFTVLQICARLEANGICSGQAFFEASQSYVPSSFTVPESSDRAYKMEGYLYPATYEFPTDSDPTDVLITMLNAYRANAGGLTDEQLIVASIVERESRSEENAALVASVIYNRLEAGMMLQMDSTREYVNDSITDSPYLEDTERFAALYNTYKCSGLPAGPICCPGARAINAALHPAETDYYYFFFGSDNENHYSTTLEEHEALIEEYGVQYG